MTAVEDHVRAEIARRGPLGFAELVAAALYLPGAGFYATGGRAGRRGDFLTSPEVGPLFGAVVARALDGWWAAAGSPDVFPVVEVGAGPGSLAVAVLAAEPRCAPSLRYVLVEVSARQRAQQAERLPLEEPSEAFAPGAEPVVDGAVPDPGPRRPVVVSLAESPRLAGPVVVLANELLDNLPFGLAERVAGHWHEVLVGERGGSFEEVLVPMGAEDGAGLDALVPDAPDRGRVPLAGSAAAWVREARLLAGAGGRVVAFDYGRRTAELAARPWLDWVRTYRGHQRGAHPFDALGTQDVTCEVPVDQLPTPASDRSQAEWLRAHGIEDLVEEGRRVWRERAAIGDLAALRARSRLTEAAALTDPEGLGAFRVLEWRGR